MQLTNWREAAAFFLAQAAKIAVGYFLAGMVFSPLYLWLYRAGGMPLMYVGTTGVGALMILAALPLFLLLRAVLAGVPPIVAAALKDPGFVSSGAEIGAYLLTALIVLVLNLIVFYLVSLHLYVPLRASGNAALILPIALTISTVIALIFFVIFIALRRGFAGPQTAPTAPGGVVSIRSVGSATGFGGAAGGRYVGSTIGFGGAIASCFNNYAVFRGRAPRPEYWYWVLFQVLLGVPLAIIDGVAFGQYAGVFLGLGALAMFLPNLAVTVRRLHDIDNSGWWILISMVPLVGGIALLVMACLPGTAGPNRFGENPA